MAATLKVEEETKENLDRLQATLTLRLGKKLSLQEILSRLVRLGWARQEELEAADQGPWQPATPEEASELRAKIRAWNDQVRREPPGRPMSVEDQEIYEEDWKT